ncbi:MAG: POT family MFS transporter [Planctomycetaceae bacterium]|nr:POT family MFS transporter [Planctomycetaceae bacterium]
MSSNYLSVPEETTGLPRGVKYIIGNEAAERFSFYGMRTILVVFMTRYLHLMSENQTGPEMTGAAANEVYHNFVAATYFFPVFGSLLSDIFVGKYRTILWLSIVYCIGHLALALMGGPGMTPSGWLLAGLFLIAFGSGGIKPCVSAHVGDQFGRKNSHLMTKVFQWFYFSINFGSTVSTALTPVLLKWYGPHVAFGVPGVLMALATLLFWMGRHVFIHVPPGGMNFFKETFSKEGIMAVLKLTIIYAFVAVFWGMFDQTGSSWVLQAENMDRNFLGVEWLESQIQVVNPILVMALIPLFQFVIYPAVDKVFKLTPIRKISIGLFLTATSFLLITMAQRLIDQGETPSIAWQLWAYLVLTSAEIMISITGLEFSYTQAPKTMKSVVMAVWLFSVSAGNLFTGWVNHSIQTPGVNQIASEVSSLDVSSDTTLGNWKLSVAETAIEGSDKPGKAINVFGVDGKAGTEDDIQLSFDDYGRMTSVSTTDNTVLTTAADRIQEAFMNSAADDEGRALPSDSEGQKIIDELRDSFGGALKYQQITRNQFRIATAGADKTPQTQWDVVLVGAVSRASTGSTETPAEYDWLEKRIIEVKGPEGRDEVEKARGNNAKTVVDYDITVGGQDKLEGAAYFDFWTKAAFYAAILFIPVGYFYKEKSYIQDNSSEPTVPEPTANASDSGDHSRPDEPASS